MSGIDILFIAAGLILLAALERYSAWRNWDTHRRNQRRQRRGLQ